MHEDIERQIEDELKKVSQHTGWLGELRDDPAFVMLSNAEAAGMLSESVKDQWATVRTAVITAESRLHKLRETVEEARRLLRASPPDRNGARRLLHGQSVRLTREEIPKEDRPPPSTSYSDPRFSLRTVRDYVADDIRTARDALEEVRGETALEEKRDLLRARLELYRGRDRQRKLGGPELDARYRRALQLLDAFPCDLDRAEEAIGQYMRMERGPGHEQ